MTLVPASSHGSGGSGITAWGSEATAALKGSGAPVGTVLPANEGDLYVDTATPLLWQANGATNTDWYPIGGPTEIYEQIIAASAASIANGATAALAMDTSVGNGVLDFTVPTAPVAVADGVYWFGVEVRGVTLTAAGSYEVALAMNVESDNVTLVSTSPASVTSQTSPNVSIGNITFIPAGNSLSVKITNHDGVATRNFTVIQGWCQKIL